MRYYRVCLSRFHCVNLKGWHHQCTRTTYSGMSIVRLTSMSSGRIYFHVCETWSVSSSFPGESISTVRLTSSVSSSHWRIWFVWHLRQEEARCIKKGIFKLIKFIDFCIINVGKKYYIVFFVVCSLSIYLFFLYVIHLIFTSCTCTGLWSEIITYILCLIWYSMMF